MKRGFLPLLFTLLIAFPVGAQADDVFLLGFTGFDYQVAAGPDPDYLAVGNSYYSVGFVTSVGSLLEPYVNFTSDEQTYYLYDMVVATRFFDGGLLEVVFNSPGRMRCYSDPKAGGTPAVYGINPPNATAPSTFTDGVVQLGGHILNFALVYDYNFNQGNFMGELHLDEGSNLAQIPTDQREGWVLGGLAGRPNETVPEGYVNQVSGEIRVPFGTPTTHTTWGAVKALYR
jgi:hypothetical protein